MPDLVRITVNGKDWQVPEGELLIRACQDHGVYIPRFCWHPRMTPVGMCRMCMVEVEGPRGKQLTISCTLPVQEGMVVHTESDAVRKAQDGVLEFLLINHPLDCPVCDRGGECPLQDQVMSYGPGESRFVEEKRHFQKPISISELVHLDRERCVQCARCTRFSEEISGDPLLTFQGRGYYTEVNTFPDEPFRSYFSGNTVQICPVGALLATPYRFRARPWDLRAVESTCPHCAVGCRISVQSSQNQVVRFLGVDNEPTNQGWLCDKGRFGYEFIGSPERVVLPLIRGENGELHEAGWEEALDLVAQRLGEITSEHGGEAVAGLGGARGTNEDAYAFGKFLRATVGTNHLDAQLGDGLDPQFVAGVTPRATIPDIMGARAILLWGPDIKEELPVLYLRVRWAAQELGAKLVIVHPRRTGLDDRAAHKVTYRPGEGPDVLRRLADGEGELAPVREALGEGPVVALVGRTGLTEDPRLAEAVAAFARQLPDGKVLPLLRRSNVYGALDMGLAPGLLPGRVAADEEGWTRLEAAWGPLPTMRGRHAAGILAGLEAGELKALVLAGADPVDDFPDGALARRALEDAEAVFVVAIDLFLTESSRRADVVLPAQAFAEKEGTVTNLEGRVQKCNALVPSPGQTRPDWWTFEELARRMGGSLGAVSAQAVNKEISEVAPAYRGITWEGLDFSEGREGIVAPGTSGTQPLEYIPVDPGLPVRRAPTALHLARVLYDRGALVRAEPSLAPLAPGPIAFLHPEDAARVGAEEGGHVLLTTASGSAELPVGLDPSLSPGTVYVPFNQDGVALGDDLAVRVSRADAEGG
ncbi:MAG: NADH-quinone oxidoreductase subunit NuoG [Actinomycetota bacterium]|nr:NADH-quinone oxidoreductase subunit NuoG [Actinomycetota bacterium]